MKKALLIGINYTGQSAQLNGCVNDINNIQNLLIKNWGYQQSNITTLLNANATEDNIMKGIEKLTVGCKAGDTLFFYYSGHGAPVANTQNADKGEQDDALIPNDYTTNGVIVDDWLYTNLAMKVPEGVTLWAFADCCHSGTMFDLKYNWMCNPTPAPGKKPNPTVYNKDEWADNFNVYILNNKETIGHVFLFSGCQDSQTSADAMINNQFSGAFTYCFLECIKNKFAKGSPKQTIGDMLKEIDSLLCMKKYQQRSQLSVGRSSDINYIFNP